MLFENNEIEKLESYIQNKSDPELYKWWAQYLESQNRLDLALKFYKQAADHCSVVHFFLEILGSAFVLQWGF